LGEDVILGAWLHRATKYCAANALRIARNRARHERKAAEMIGANQSADWEEISGMLDEAVNRLPEMERRVIVLRFFQGKGHAEVAAEMGISLAAATKRSERALERLRNMLRGSGATAAALSQAMAMHAIRRAPGELSARVCGGAGASTGASAIARGAFAAMLWGEMKLAMVIGAGVVILLGGATGIFFESMHGATNVTTPVASVKPQALAADQSPTTEPSWREAFDAVYTLKDEEVLRNIRPPYIAERAGFVHDVYDADHVDGSHANGSLADLKTEGRRSPGAFFLVWDPTTGRVEHWIRENDDAWTLGSLIMNLIGLTPDHTMMPETLEKAVVPGDWVIRKGATPEEKLAAFQQICSKTPGAFTAVKQTIMRDVIVAHGTYHKGDVPGDFISVHLDTDKGRERQAGDVYYYFRRVGDNLHMPVVNEWTGCDNVRIEFTSPKVSIKGVSPQEAQQRIDMVLDELGGQLGIKMFTEKRSMETWVFVAGKG
jgi:hypothetical protein